VDRFEDVYVNVIGRLLRKVVSSGFTTWYHSS